MYYCVIRGKRCSKVLALLHTRIRKRFECCSASLVRTAGVFLLKGMPRYLSVPGTSRAPLVGPHYLLGRADPYVSADPRGGSSRPREEVSSVWQALKEKCACCKNGTRNASYIVYAQAGATPRRFGCVYWPVDIRSRGGGVDICDSATVWCCISETYN